jgi:(1->4)-alpha-D-glucan 1-alpha-D-glucosylmutase
MEPIGRSRRSARGRVTSLRSFAATAAITVVPRLVMRLEENWMNTTLELPSGRWRNELTADVVQGIVPVAELLAQFPVALLSRAESNA